MLEQDFIMRDIETITLSISKFVFGKDEPSYVSDGDEAWDGLNLRLTQMLGRGEFNDAEDLLFDAMVEGDDRALELAVDFYARLNHLNDDRLKENHFTRQEIEEGLREAMTRFDVVLP